MNFGRSISIVLILALAITTRGDEPARHFRAQCLKLADQAAAEGRSVVVGDNGWLFLPAELRHIGIARFWGEDAKKVSRAAKPEQADPLPAILDFKAQLDRAGIELWLLPVPPKAIVHADQLSVADAEADKRLDAEHQAFYQLLRDKGVTVIDLTDELIEHRDDREGAAFCRTDTHWSGVTCVRAARRLAGAVKERDWAHDVPPLKLRQETRTIEITGDLLRLLEDPAARPERLPLRFISTEAGGPVSPDRNSPILLLGDSHTLVFHAGNDMHAEGAGLADQLAWELRFAVDVIGVKGSGATPARVNLLRRARAEPNYLESKKLVIWCFAAREFTESAGWPKVPVVK